MTNSITRNAIASTVCCCAETPGSAGCCHPRRTGLCARIVGTGFDYQFPLQVNQALPFGVCAGSAGTSGVSGAVQSGGVVVQECTMPLTFEMWLACCDNSTLGCSGYRLWYTWSRGAFTTPCQCAEDIALGAFYGCNPFDSPLLGQFTNVSNCTCNPTNIQWIINPPGARLQTLGCPCPAAGASVLLTVSSTCPIV